jgi:hypothetical protein
MAWQGKVASVVGTAVLSIGFYATDAIHKVESNPTALYMAGQFWVMAGERECGLELIERAARATKTNAPQANVERQVEATPQMCSREPVPPPRKETPATKVNPQPQLVTVNVAPANVEPMLIRASAAPTPPPGPDGFTPGVHEFAMPREFPNVDEFVAAKVLVVRDGQPMIDPALERRISQIQAEAQRRAHKRMKVFQRKAFQKQMESLAQRS